MNMNKPLRLSATIIRNEFSCDYNVNDVICWMEKIKSGSIFYVLMGENWKCENNFFF